MQIYFVLRRTIPAVLAALIPLVAAGCATAVSTGTTTGAESYVGSYKDGLRSGQGTYSWPDGRRYVGTFRDDRPDGTGTYSWPDGKKYVGEFHAGRAEGQGVYSWPDGRSYVGALRADLPNGQGTLTLGDGRQFTGEFRDGDYVDAAAAAAAIAPAEIPLEKRGGTFIVPVMINDEQSLDFYLDSGSADVTIPAATFEALQRAGTIRADDIIGAETYLMANGATRKSTIFRIRSLKVGAVVLHNVRGSLSDQTGPPLLGMSFLGRFSSWSVDNRRSVLVLK